MLYSRREDSALSPLSRQLRVRQFVRRRRDDGRSGRAHAPARSRRSLSVGRRVSVGRRRPSCPATRRSKIRTKLHEPERSRGSTFTRSTGGELGELGEQPRELRRKRSQHHVHARCEVSDVYLPLLFRTSRLPATTPDGRVCPSHARTARRAASSCWRWALASPGRARRRVSRAAGRATAPATAAAWQRRADGSGGTASRHGQKRASVRRSRSQKACRCSHQKVRTTPRDAASAWVAGAMAAPETGPGASSPGRASAGEEESDDEWPDVSDHEDEGDATTPIWSSSGSRPGGTSEVRPSASATAASAAASPASEDLPAPGFHIARSASAFGPAPDETARAPPAVGDAAPASAETKNAGWVERKTGDSLGALFGGDTPAIAVEGLETHASLAEARVGDAGNSKRAPNAATNATNATNATAPSPFRASALAATTTISSARVARERRRRRRRRATVRCAAAAEYLSNTTRTNGTNDRDADGRVSRPNPNAQTLWRRRRPPRRTRPSSRRRRRPRSPRRRRP